MQSSGVPTEDLSRCLLCGSPGFVGTRCDTCLVERPMVESYVVQAACSRCHEPLEQHAIETDAGKGIKIYSCPSCRWLFMSARAWARLFADPRFVVDIERTVPMPTVRVEEALALMPCPACAKEMDRARFAATSFIVIDVCRFAHGVWLDVADLRRVVDYQASPREMIDPRPSGHTARPDVEARVLREEAPRHASVMSAASKAPSVLPIAAVFVIGIVSIVAGMRMLGPKGCRQFLEPDQATDHGTEESR